ncbi:MULTISPECIES: hypothetical protein [Okeania]|nr:MULTISPECIES: hypothetical protein [Okeania]NES75078.1 hypothetical protein [Okeania sp. SIO1H4]NES93400.1 hypothetical protein [Okeania sp. SIO2B9]NET22883.1 hypothetical protein [Okeania sp. SIO1H5]NET75600.1 hypothetical protein [Okeania sp. SIO1F9]NET92967.1 hypothetical protein [Okeania sp. SIO1H2]
MAKKEFGIKDQEILASLKKETGDRRQETGGKLHGDSQRRAAPRLRSPK